MRAYALDTRHRFGRAASTQQLMIRGALFLAALVLLSGGVGLASRVTHDDPALPYTGTATMTELAQVRHRLDVARGSFELASLERNRSQAIAAYATEFKVAADLAATIFDAALREGLDPELAFRLVRVESRFNPRARSSAAAIGLAQVQVATARHYERRITEQQLYQPERNLRIGFRYLRDLAARYDNDMRLALLAYNVGPARLNEILEGGRTPQGRYASSVLDGYNYRSRSD